MTESNPCPFARPAATVWPTAPGELAAQIRAFDWAGTPLGPISAWPQSLRTLVDLMLASAQPVYVAWGPALTTLYNDGYGPILGDKHPGALGRSYREVWPEIWEEYRPLVDAVLEGEAHHFVDHPVPLAGRAGRPVSWFTFSWTPLRDETGAIAGFYCVATETTEKVQAEQARLRLALDIADLGTWSWDLATGSGEIDERGAAIVGLEPGFLADIGGAQATRVHPADLDRLQAEAAAGIASGEAFALHYRVVHADGSLHHVTSRARVVTDGAGRPIRLMGTNRDVTAEREAVTALRASETRQAYLLRLSDRLRPLADPRDIQYEAARTLGEHLGADRVAYGEVQDDGESFTVHRDYHGPGLVSIEGRHRFAEYGAYVATEFAAGRTIVVTDVAAERNHTAAELATYAAAGVRAYVAVPLVKAGRIAAYLAVNQTSPRAWTLEEVALLEETAERTWDAVERARALHALQAARDESDRRRRLYEAVTGSTPDLIYVFDRTYRFTYANDALLAMWGRTWEESIGKRLLEVGYEPWHAEMHEREIDRIIATKEPVRGEVAFPHATLGRRIYDYILVPVLGADGEVEVIAGTTRDITELRRLAQLKDEFIAIVSHELKTPVTGVKAYAQILQRRFRKAGDEAAATLVSKLDSQLDKLTVLIGDLLDVTKIESGQLKFHEELFDFDALVDELIEELQPTADQHRIERRGRTGAAIRGDRERTGQVLTNLLSNAVKYSPGADRVLVHTTAGDGEVTVRVQDFGVGITEEDRERVFERFYRVRGPEHDPVPGLGLGLYITAQIVARQGGRIWVEGTPGVGSTFCFTLPIAAEPHAASAPVSPAAMADVPV